MGYEAERAAIEARLATNWTTTPIKWENIAFEPGTAAAYIECYVVPADSQQISLGSPALFRAVSLISINVRGRLQVGTKTLRQYVDSLCAIFRAKRFSGITCKAPRVTKVGEVEGWYVYNITFPYFTNNVFSL